MNTYNWDYRRASFVFYESFYNSISHLDNTKDILDAYESIVRYWLYLEEPWEDVSQTVKAIFEVCKPLIDRSIQRFYERMRDY